MYTNRSSRIPSEAWESRKEDIRRAYLDEDKKLDGSDGVISLMSTRHGFTATRSQYETRLRNWGFRKYAKGDDWQIIARILDQRSEQGKASEVYISGEPVNPNKILKEVARNRSRGTTPHNDALPPHITIKTPPQPTIERSTSAILGKRPRQTDDENASVNLQTATEDEIDQLTDLHRGRPRGFSIESPQASRPSTLASRRSQDLSLRPSQPAYLSSPLSKLTRVQRAKPTSVKNSVISISHRQEEPESNSILDDIDQYHHEPIRENQCRLLFIIPGSADDEITAELLVVDDDFLETSTYPYEALSYAWGDPSPTHKITIQGNLADGSDLLFSSSSSVSRPDNDYYAQSSIMVTYNLHEALKNLRRLDTPLLLWVDALCINMADLEERRHQMQKMSFIFRNAVNVCIWLGSRDSSSTQAIEFTKTIVNLKTIDSVVHDPDNAMNWASFFRLLRRPWFSRRWVVMEVALAKEATIHCGSDVVHWNDFRDAISILHRYTFWIDSYLKEARVTNIPIPSLVRLQAKTLVDVSSRMIRKGPDGTIQSTMTIETLVSSLCDLYSPDPRDTIYALLGICKEFTTLKKGSNPPSVLVPDYAKYQVRIYTEFVGWVIKTTSSLDIICRRWAQPCEDLPSWILDFNPESKSLHRRPVDSFVGLPGKSHYNASGSTNAEVRFESRVPRHDWPYYLARLTAKGYEIGRVDRYSEPIRDGVIHRVSLECLGWSQELSDEMQEAPEQLWRTLVADRGPHGNFAPAYYHRAALFCLLHSNKDGHLDTQELLKKDQSTVVREFLERVQYVTWDRVILQGGSNLPTSEHLDGIGPPETRVGDTIAILHGCTVPVILRYTDGHYQFIGEAFIYGIMDGETGFDGPTESFTLV